MRSITVRHILRLANSTRRRANRAARYPEQIELLRGEFAQLIPGSSDTVTYYTQHDSRITREALRGNIAIQYSPYDHGGGSDGNTPQARVRVFCENQRIPVLDKSWDSPYASTSTGTGSGSESGDNGVDSREFCYPALSLEKNANTAFNTAQLALATYIDPGANVQTWNRLINFPADKVSVVVANVVNGPDSAANEGWTDVIPRAAASGKKVLGYVRTGYLGVSFQHFTTRLGSSKTSDWVAQIQEDVDQWYRLYPDHMGGIFFDEGWNDCGVDNVNAQLYKFITQQTKRKYPGAYTVLNPGAPMPQCFEHSADTLLTAEVSYATYTSDAYVPCDWTPSDSRKLWHIIYDVPESEVASVAALARERGAGLLHITDDIEPNPYDTVPGDSYMQTLMAAVAGGQPMNEGTYAYPGGPSSSPPSNFQLVSFDYSSATVSWSTSPNAIGYQIYQGSDLVLSLTPEMTTVTIGSLAPGTYYHFNIFALNGDGTLTASSASAIAMTTKSLPGAGQTVSQMSVSGGESQTIYKATILVPHAFVRVFVWDKECYDPSHFPLTSWAAWPINYDALDVVCNHYMVEGEYLYHYTGSGGSAAFENAKWTWTQLAEAPLVQSGYEYTWTVPMGTSTMNTSHFLIQVQGYGPMANVFQPCPWGTAWAADAKVTAYCL